MLTQWGYVAIFLIIAIAFALTPLLLSRLLRPRNPDPVKHSTYECGVETEGVSWIRYYAGFYIYALIFVIFDVETIFLYPWAVAFGSLGVVALVEILLFVAILALGLVYAWKKQVLRWW